MNDFVVSMLLGTMASTGGFLPFWATTGHYGLIDDNTSAIAQIAAYSQFDSTKVFQYRFGGSFAAAADHLYDNGTADFRLMADELYGSICFRNVPLTLDLGMKHQPVDFAAAGRMINGESTLGSLSTTGGHLTWSGNARTMPGYTLTLDPLAIPFTGKHLWIYGAFGDYKTLDTETSFVPNRLIHSTKAFLKVDFLKRFSLHLGLDHYAVWGGDAGTNITLENYLRMAAGQSAGSDGTLSDQINVIGDQGGSEMIKLTYAGEGYDITLQHEIPYSDRSGMRFVNFPDGVNTACLSWRDRNRWVTDILYEYAYTMYQSGPIHRESYDSEGHSTIPESEMCTTGIDNYFNNGEYPDGWTYFGRTIGYPLFYTNAPDALGRTHGVRNNRLRAHHIALSGNLFHVAPYKLMLTYSHDYGTYKAPYTGESQYQKPWGTVQETPLDQFSAAFTGQIPLLRLLSGLSLSYGLYLDAGAVLPDSFGFAAGLKWVM